MFLLAQERPVPRSLSKRLKKSLTLAVYWENGSLVCEDYFSHVKIAISPAIVELLDLFRRSVDPKDAAKSNGFSSAEFRGAVDRLKRLGFLLSEDDKSRESIEKWHWGQAARHFFFGTKDASVHLPKAKRLAYAQKLLKESSQPSIYKEYPQAPKVALHRPESFASKAGEVLSKVRDTRDFAFKPIPKECLSEILYLSCGEQGKINAKPWGDLLIKTYYSAGNRHPIEVYPVVVAVDGVEPGLYHYSVKDHALELLKKGDFSAKVKAIANGQEWVKSASVYFLLTAVMERTSFKYRHDYFLQSIFADAGSLMQNIRIVAVGLGLNSCPTHSLRQSTASKFLGLEGARESLVGFALVGCNI